MSFIETLIEVVDQLNPELVRWFVAELVLVLTFHLALWRVTLSMEPEDHPKKKAVIVSLAFTSILATAAAYFISLVAGFIIISLSLGMLILIITPLSRRDAQAIHHGEDLVTSLQLTDAQINSIQGLLTEYAFTDEENTPSADEIIEQIVYALQYILTEMESLLELDHRTHRSQLSILELDRQRCNVLAVRSIDPDRIRVMEQSFRLGKDPPSSIAGLAALRQSAVCIPDLADPNSEDAKFWIKSHPDEKKRGTIISFPILEGPTDSRGSNVLGVVSATSRYSYAFDCDLVKGMLRPYIEKIEMLLRMRQTTLAYEARRETAKLNPAVNRDSASVTARLAAMANFLELVQGLIDLLRKLFRS